MDFKEVIRNNVVAKISASLDIVYKNSQSNKLDQEEQAFIRDNEDFMEDDFDDENGGN